ncbi:hypothetical protein B0H16DRAFT_1731331 [Mycena metata]|uniref:Uncharacterized protein n=1 Tax=Mycena metata TaxID=1033252 RepID=A0AAD7MWM9_9AGAR|nr:hypothetical protein B0H16DRAFT_1731331 [Mycena metata]
MMVACPLSFLPFAAFGLGFGGSFPGDGGRKDMEIEVRTGYGVCHSSAPRDSRAVQEEEAWFGAGDGGETVMVGGGGRGTAVLAAAVARRAHTGTGVVAAGTCGSPWGVSPRSREETLFPTPRLGPASPAFALVLVSGTIDVCEFWRVARTVPARRIVPEPLALELLLSPGLQTATTTSPPPSSSSTSSSSYTDAEDDADAGEGPAPGDDATDTDGDVGADTGDGNLTTPARGVCCVCASFSPLRRTLSVLQVLLMLELELFTPASLSSHPCPRAPPSAEPLTSPMTIPMPFIVPIAIAILIIARPTPRSFSPAMRYRAEQLNHLLCFVNPHHLTTFHAACPPLGRASRTNNVPHRFDFDSEGAIWFGGRKERRRGFAPAFGGVFPGPLFDASHGPHDHVFGPHAHVFGPPGDMGWDEDGDPETEAEFFDGDEGDFGLGVFDLVYGEGGRDWGGASPFHFHLDPMGMPMPPPMQQDDEEDDTMPPLKPIPAANTRTGGEDQDAAMPPLEAIPGRRCSLPPQSTNDAPDERAAGVGREGTHGDEFASGHQLHADSGNVSAGV